MSIGWNDELYAAIVFTTIMVVTAVFVIWMLRPRR